MKKALALALGIILSGLLAANVHASQADDSASSQKSAISTQKASPKKAAAKKAAAKKAPATKTAKASIKATTSTPPKNLSKRNQALIEAAEMKKERNTLAAEGTN